MPVKDSPTMLRVFRDEIGRLLIDEAHRLHPDKIKFHFGAPIDSVNLEKQTVSVSQSSVKEVSAAASILLFLVCIIRLDTNADTAALLLHCDRANIGDSLPA